MLRIITGALVFGAVAFMSVTLVLNSADISGEPDILSWLALGFSVFDLVLHLVMPNSAAAKVIAEIDAQKLRDAEQTQKYEMLAPAFRVRHITACAVLEGAVFLNLVAYLMAPFFGNLIAAGFLILLMVFRIPSATAIEFWVKDRIREIEIS